MPDETRISYAAILGRAVRSVIAACAQDGPTLCAECERDAAALRSLAALVEGVKLTDAELIDRRLDLMRADLKKRSGQLDVVQIGNALEWEKTQMRVGALIRAIATGYAPTDPKEGESNALRPQQDDNFGYGQ